MGRADRRWRQDLVVRPSVRHPRIASRHSDSRRAANSRARSALLDRSVRRRPGNFDRTDRHRAAPPVQRRVGARSVGALDSFDAQPGALFRRDARLDRRLRHDPLHRGWRQDLALLPGLIRRRASTGTSENVMTWYRFGEWILRRRFLVLGVVGALTAFFGYFAAQTQLVTSFGDLLPQNHPFIQIAHKYDEFFGSVNNVTVMIEVKEGTIYNTDVIKKIVQMTRDMDLVYGIQHGSVRSIATASYFRPLAGGVILNTPVLPNGEIPKTAQELDELKSNVHKNPGVVFGNYISLDDRAAVVEGSFLESRLDYTRIFNEVRKIVVDPEKDASVHIYYGGQPILYGWVYHYTPEFLWIFVATVLAVWILLYWYFRDWRGALRPTISGVICAIWGLGFIRLLGYGLDPLVLVIPFLITARAVSHSVQMHDRYYEEYYRLRDKKAAILSAFAELFVPSFSGILADAFGVLIILLVPVLFLQKLAVTASFWIAAIIVSELILNPIVYYYLQPPHIAVIEKRENGVFK